MTARDDYPALAKWAGYRYAQRDAEAALNEIDRLRAELEQRASTIARPPAPVPPVSS